MPKWLAVIYISIYICPACCAASKLGFSIRREGEGNRQRAYLQEPLHEAIGQPIGAPEVLRVEVRHDVRGLLPEVHHLLYISSHSMGADG